MNIPLFEILILLFVLWPLIQRFLEKNKGREGEITETDYDVFNDPYTESPKRDGRSGSNEWDDAMKELEMIFSGEPPKKPDPPQRSESQRRPPEASDRRQRINEMKEQERGRRNNRLDLDMVNSRRQSLESMQSRPLKQRPSTTPIEVTDAQEMVDELMASENPIYTSLNKAPEIADESIEKNYSVYSDVRDPQRLREFYVMKEILDKPVSQRRRRNFV